jgi:hypothetical protein
MLASVSIVLGREGAAGGAYGALGADAGRDAIGAGRGAELNGLTEIGGIGNSLS